MGSERTSGDGRQRSSEERADEIRVAAWHRPQVTRLPVEQTLSAIGSPNDGSSNGSLPG
jgi:hypothetical protein